jgi:hypothetical protein
MLMNKTVGIILLILGAFLIIVGIFCLLSAPNFDFVDIFGYVCIFMGFIIIVFALWFISHIKLDELSQKHAEKNAVKKAAAKKVAEAKAAEKAKAKAEKQAKADAAKKAKDAAKQVASKAPKSYAAMVGNLGDSNLAKAIRRGAELIDSKVVAGRIDDAKAKASFDGFMAYKPKIGTPDEPAATIEVAQMIGFLSKA